MSKIYHFNDCFERSWVIFFISNNFQKVVYKDPITDPGKKSKKGRLSLELQNGVYKTMEEGSGDPKKVLNY